MSQPRPLPPDQTVLPPIPEQPPGTETSDVHELAEFDPDDEVLEAPEKAPPSSVDVFADFEDELESETTRIDDSNLLAEQSTSILESAPAQPFLDVERGKDKGREFVLQEGENGVGRGIDNDVILADVAVSRRHLKIICTAGRLTMRDLGSGNGTLVNGTKVSTIELAEGDRLELGETTLVVRLPGAPLPAEDPYIKPDEATDEQNITSGVPSPAAFGTPSNPLSIPNGPGYQPELTPSGTSAPPRVQAAVPRGSVVLPKPLVFAVIAGGGLLLLISAAALAALAIGSGGDDDEVPAVVAPSHYDLGVRAYDEQRWTDAAREFQSAQRGDPSGVQDPAQLRRYLSRTALAIRDQPIIDQAQRLFEARDLDAAADAAASLRDEDSPLYERARSLREEIRADQSLRDRSAPTAPGTAEEPPTEAATGAEAPAEAATRAEAPAEAATGAEAPAEAAPESASSGRGRRWGRTARRGRQRGRRGAGSTTRSIIDLYIRGDFVRAAEMATTAASVSNTDAAESRRLTQLGRNITSFGRLWRQIQTARFGPAVGQQMSQAMALDTRIASNPRYRDQLRAHVVRLQLATALRSSDPVRRCGQVRVVSRIDPRNADVRQATHECEVVASAMMTQARQLPPGGRRVRIYRQVRRMVPESSTVGQNAARLLQENSRSQTYNEDE